MKITPVMLFLFSLILFNVLSVSFANFFIDLHKAHYGDQMVCYPWGTHLTTRSLWHAVPIFPGQRFNGSHPYKILTATSEPHKLISGIYGTAWAGVCVGNEADGGYEGSPSHTGLAWWYTYPHENSSCELTYKVCDNWRYDGWLQWSCTRQSIHCFALPPRDNRPYPVIHNASLWPFPCNSSLYMETDMGTYRGYCSAFQGSCLCQHGCRTIPGFFFLKKGGRYSNYHIGCSQVAIEIVKLGDVSCPSPDHLDSPPQLKRSCRAAVHASTITKEFCADKELLVHDKGDVIGIGVGSVGISTSVYFAHFQEQTACAIVRLGNDTYDALRKLGEGLHNLRLYSEQNRAALDFLLAGKGGLCKAIGKNKDTCVMALNDTDISSDLEDIQDILHRIKHLEDTDWSWLTSWLPGAAWLRSIIIILFLIIFTAIIGCCMFLLPHICQTCMTQVTEPSGLTRKQLMQIQYNRLPQYDEDDFFPQGLFISGVVGDRLNMRNVLSFGMCSSALVVFVFGTLTEWLHFYNKWFYIGLWIVNGLLQSTGWPCVVAVMGNWFGKAGRGLVFGFWSACASVGNIIGAFLASSVLQYGYEYAFLVTASVQFAGGIVVFFGLVISPKEVGLPDVGEDDDGLVVEEDVHEPLIGGNIKEEDEDSDPNYSIQATGLSSNDNTQLEAIGFFQACCLPGVILYSLAYACLKLVNYSFFFWLPFYLTRSFDWKETDADKLSIWYDVGGILGGSFQGYISDRLQKRAPVLAVSLVLAVAFLFGYSRSPNSKLVNAVLMALTGCFIGGPSNMISSAISADLGRQEVVKGNSEALATVTGIVDGTGSLGAAVGQYLVSLIQDNLGWMWVFNFFILMISLTVVFITPLIVKEIQMLLAQRRLHRLAG